ncbi:MAG: hypothetical protein ACLR78_06575 [Roseburia sp.]
MERLEETLQTIKKIAETRTVPDTTADVTWTKPSTVMPVSEKIWSFSAMSRRRQT